MTVVDTAIQLQEFSKRDNIYTSGNNSLCFQEKFHNIGQYSTSCDKTSLSINSNTLSFTPQNFQSILENFRYSIDKRTCDIDILNNLEIAINNGIDKGDYQLLNYEFNKIFMVYKWPSKWYSRVLSNAIFLSAYFRDSNLAISFSNCFRTFTLLDNFHLHSDVIFNSISNSLDIAGTSWDINVYKSIIEFSFTFIHTGSDSLWEIISNIIYKLAPRLEFNSLSALSGDDLGLLYCFNGLTVSRFTIAIFSYIKGVLDNKIKSITSDYNESVFERAKKCIIDLMNQIIAHLPKSNLFIEDLCKISESPENIIAIYIIRHLVKSSLLSTEQLVIIGLWSINCSKSIYSKWDKHLFEPNILYPNIDKSKSLNSSIAIEIPDKLKDCLEEHLLECDDNILIQMNHLHLTNYQSHVWASLILLNNNDNSSIFELVVPYLTYNYSNQYSNKYFTDPVPTLVFYSFIFDLPKIIINHFKSIILKENQLNILSALEKLISADLNLIDNSLIETLKTIFSSKDHKIKLKLVHTLICCISYKNVENVIENILLELMANKTPSVRLSALKLIHKIMINYNCNLKLDTIKNIALIYMSDTSRGVCQASIQILSDFFFFKFIENYDKYNINDVVEILLFHLQGRKSLINYYNGLDFTRNPIDSMNKICNGFSQDIIDFWYNYLMTNIKSKESCKIKLLYTMHMFSDVFKSYYTGKIYEISSLFRHIPMDDETYHLLVELICKNMTNHIDDKLRNELVNYVNYDLKDSSNSAIQSKMKLCLICNIDITSIVTSSLDTIKSLLNQKELKLVDQNIKVSIWKLGSILGYLSQISLIDSKNSIQLCSSVVSDLLDIGLAYIGYDDNLLIIIISSLCCYISHFENIKYLNMEKFKILIQKSISRNETLAVAVLVTIRKFYSLKFNNTFNKYSDELGNLFASLINNNLDTLLYKLGNQTRRWCLVILQGLVRDVCYPVLIDSGIGSIVDHLEEGMEIIASNREDIGREGQNVMKLTKSFKKLYNGICTGNFVKLVKNKLEGALSGGNFKAKLGFREKLVFVDLLISFTIAVCEGPSLETSLFLKEVKKLTLSGRVDKHSDPLKYYTYKRLQYLSGYLNLVSKNNKEQLVKYVNCNECARVRLFKKCLKMTEEMD